MTTPPRPQPQPAPQDRAGTTRLRIGRETWNALAACLTDRDRWLLEQIWTCQVLTTAQVTDLAFDNVHTANRRLLALVRLRALDRFRPFVPRGSAPWHYVLDEPGAMIVAADHDLPPAQFREVRRRARALQASQRLRHTVGVNGVYTALHAAARRNPGMTLAAWWPEQRCLAEWQQHARIRPDAYGRWRENSPNGEREVDFFLEFDTGSEPLNRVAAKIPAYIELADASGIGTPLLFWFPSGRREAAARPRLRYALPIATTSADAIPAHAAAPGHRYGPAGPIWLPAGSPGPRLRLIDLANL
jgi:hypothetical protein